MRIGLVELIVIVIVGIALIKPEKLKDIIGSVSKALRIIKEENEKINKDVIEPIQEAVKPVTEPIEDIIKPVQETKQELVQGIQDIKDSVTPKVNLRK